MALQGPELVQYARDCASRGQDLYAFLGVDATTPKEDIHRAWRRAGLKYHPDKAGANYDPAKYESYERARDVLSDPAAREAYDGAVRAALQKKRRFEEMSDERKRLVEDLERREEEARVAREIREGKRPKTQADAAAQAERNRAVAAGRKIMEERARLMREAEERNRQRRSDRSGTPASAGDAAAGDETAPRSKPAQAPNPAQTASPNPESRTPERTQTASAGTDHYDERIADLERRLKEAQERKAARKEARKAERAAAKGDEQSSRRPGQSSPPAARHRPTNSPDDAVEPIADEQKASKPRSFSFRPDAPVSAPSSPARDGTSSSSFAPMMERLKAAQAKKEEERRRRAEVAGE